MAALPAIDSLASSAVGLKRPRPEEPALSDWEMRFVNFLNNDGGITDDSDADAFVRLLGDANEVGGLTALARPRVADLRGQ